jgi:hypothetical protein
MRRLWLWGAAAVCLAAVGAACADFSTKEKEGTSCGSFGTSVEFAESPAEAAKQAKKQEKLVFILHVSGNFEDPKFT